MIDIVRDWNENEVRLRPGTYWHLFRSGGLLKHNARMGKGVVFSVSFIAEAPGMEKAVTPFFMGRFDDIKEALWENVRTKSFAALPSRLKAFYCFESRELAERAQREWFASREQGDRELLELRISEDAIIHRCDAMWLETSQDQWPLSADRYWKGEMTAAPFPEVLVHGGFYFPGWEQFPIAF
ncbi:hypothetical protein V1290_002514 [Bradyrhizobium sp. AZCC 1578]|uniref:hypothetical protein n=1 Tax=Bradyrhizobium sp. AZCC 1578 TaxID=3117027 RepID=UPI002FF3FEE7